MKKLLSSLLVGLFLLTGALQAQALGGFRFGLKAGIAVNSLHLNEKVFASNNRTGFTGGVMLQWMPGIIGVGIDASAMYVRRTSEVYCFGDDQYAPEMWRDVSRDYFEIPVNLKWQFSIPVIGQFVKPFLTTGPDFSWLMSRTYEREGQDAYWKNRKFDLAWNFGFGLELFNKVQLHASYGLGLRDTGSGEALYGKNPVDGKNRFWTITAAYMF